MTAIEIILVLVGVSLIIVSIFLSEKGNEHASTNVYEVWSKKDEDSVHEHLDTVIEQQIEDAVRQTEERCKKISNEKIMAVNEFSTQVLTKIEENHKETVFLYHMLDEKEKELKTTNYESLEVKETEPEEQEQEEPVAIEAVPLADTQQGVNEQILSRYKEGLSVLDISRALGIGQGEVKLVIDLYKDKRTK